MRQPIVDSWSMVHDFGDCQGGAVRQSGTLYLEVLYAPHQTRDGRMVWRRHAIARGRVTLSDLQPGFTPGSLHNHPIA